MLSEKGKNDVGGQKFSYSTSIGIKKRSKTTKNYLREFGIRGVEQQLKDLNEATQVYNK